jgi:hypothetical protein
VAIKFVTRDEVRRRCLEKWKPAIERAKKLGLEIGRAHV